MMNGHVTGDVTWPWKVKVVTQIYLDANILKTVVDRNSNQIKSSLGINRSPIGKGMWQIDWARDRSRHVMVTWPMMSR